jgi:hypothetical protein
MSLPINLAAVHGLPCFFVSTIELCSFHGGSPCGGLGGWYVLKI